MIEVLSITSRMQTVINEMAQDSSSSNHDGGKYETEYETKYGAHLLSSGGHSSLHLPS